jgi:adenine-specific DNA-methyltransferase
MPTLNWIGKDKIINHHQEVPYKVLNHEYGFSENGKTNDAIELGNLIINGDNLEALKSLLPKYEGKVNCIYIDPPYNTGNESWVYNDNVNSPQIKKWLGKTVGKESEDLTRHDKWLCMMYPRLKLLHKLLAKDGAIFISIDDNEQANLKLMMDEIFGTSNFIRAIACVNNPKGRSDDKYIATAHETILVYKKNQNLELGGFKPDEKITKRYNKVDDYGIYREIDLRKTGDNDKREDRPNLFYFFLFNRKTNEFYPTFENEIPDDFIQIKPTRADDTDGNWRWGINSAIENKHLLIPNYMNVRKKWTIMAKDYLTDEKIIKPTSVWDFKEVNSERGTETFIKDLGFNKNDFPNPKPVGTIERILSIATNKNSIILDSFAGSGTTAHAVLNLNKQDGGNRKFILIEMENYAETITAERVKRVINGYADKEPTGGSFDYYTLGEPLFDENNNLNENVGIEKIREYVWFTETRNPFEIQEMSTPFLGSHNNTSYYFIYEKEVLTTLDYDSLAQYVQQKAEQYIIYADNCLLPETFMRAKNIEFKKIPRDITRF